MKAVTKLVVLVSLGVLAPVAALADVLEQTYLDTCRKDPGVPVPIAVVSPAVSSEYVGSRLEVEFTVDQTGKPVDLAVLTSADHDLAAAVVDAVKKWKFKPAERDGVPVATKVVLPVRIVDPEAEHSVYAATD